MLHGCCFYPLLHNRGFGEHQHILMFKCVTRMVMVVTLAATLCSGQPYTHVIDT
jgi:hypothetical protein